MAGTDPAALRAQARRRRLMRTVVAGVVAVAAVVAGILLLNVTNGKKTIPPTANGGVTQSPSPPATPGPGESASPSPTPSSPSPSSPAPGSSASSGSGGASGGSGGSGGSVGSGGSGGSSKGGSESVAAAEPVVVYNDSKIQGLGEKAAAKVRAAGYRVPRVNGIPAQIKTTTVYYNPKDAAAAQTLLSRVPGINRALPRPSWILNTNTLILVVTRDFPV